MSLNQVRYFSADQILRQRDVSLVARHHTIALSRNRTDAKYASPTEAVGQIFGGVVMHGKSTVCPGCLIWNIALSNATDRSVIRFKRIRPSTLHARVNPTQSVTGTVHRKSESRPTAFH
jgi:hypothetical protein